jgi:hypothetical protein
VKLKTRLEGQNLNTIHQCSVTSGRYRKTKEILWKANLPLKAEEEIT